MAFLLNSVGTDPCAVVGGQKWVNPKDLRACFESKMYLCLLFPSYHFSDRNFIKIIEVINKTLAFHTSDLLGDLARIQKQSYSSDYDLHIDFSRTLKRLDDGHCVWINSCFVPLFLNFLPTPLVLLTDSKAFQVASAEFADEIAFWQNALPGSLKGQLASLSGAEVLLINGQDPFVAVDANAQITGSFQGFGTRQNSCALFPTFLRKLQPRQYGWTIGYCNFTDTASWRANNCVAVDGTNGVNLYATTSSSTTNSPLIKFQQQSPVPAQVARQQPLNVMLDSSPSSDIVLPPPLQPALPAVNGSRSVSQFYLLKDGKTGVMALGSFSDNDFNAFLLGMLHGLQSLQALGATQLIVDVSNNGGGFICAAHWLHLIIAGPKSTTVPQAGLDTKARDGPLAQLITDRIVDDNADPQNVLMYNPTNWANASDVFFAPGTNWLQPPVRTTINGRADAFSKGEECAPSGYPTTPPTTALFDPKKVVIVTMNKKEGSQTVVVGGKSDVQQQYCGTVGGQSTDFSTIDTEVKSVGLKNNSLAPPDLLVNGVQGITWRLGFGVIDPTQPEEWQSRPATVNLPLTADIVNNPTAIWEAVAKRVF
ncbi:hypothetical protein CPB84DRAFT_1837997 [Gymnopilus junonius]|uniref:Tail specific protease domain-containing protein n=1 Tax=Gymnopilus junonius TaxID=109634 RepID=A0A9P5TIF0_GYMJU|nr:hypothetical protein CPB84DRAFT_1837997 [Gymnopilus junonius]